MGSLFLSPELWFSHSSKVPGSVQAEGADWINVLNAQEILLEVVKDIYYEFWIWDAASSDMSTGVFIEGSQWVSTSSVPLF
jgi:hypothetical protein